MRSFSACALGAVVVFYIPRLYPVHAARDHLILDLHRSTTPKHTSNAKERRQASQNDDDILIDLTGNELGYNAILRFGIPPVPIQLHVGAAASDTWVNIASSTFCADSSNDCTEYGYYDPAASETSYWESDDFTETYVSGASGYPILNGSWYNDTVGIGSASLYNAQFGVANQSYQTVGVLGLGYGSLESSTKEYYNIPFLLNKNNETKCNAWSIWLDPVNQTNGQLIFGGIDSDKFIGQLETFSIQTSPPDTPGATYNYPWIYLADMRVISNGQNTSLTNNNNPVLITIDPAENFSYLPQSYFEAMVTTITGVSYPACVVNGTYNPNCFAKYGIQTCDCAFQANKTTLEVIFDSTPNPVAYSIPMSEMIENTGGLCYFLFIPTNNTDAYVLGQNFHRTTYVAYDLDHNTISMAPANANSKKSSVQVIQSNGIAAGVFSGAVTNSASATLPPATATMLPSAIKSTSPSSSASSGVHSGLSTGAKVGTGVGVPLGFLALVALGALLFFRRRRQNRDTQPEIDSTYPQGYQADKQTIGSGGDGHVFSHTSPRNTYTPTATALMYQQHELPTAGYEDGHLGATRNSRPLSDTTSSELYAFTAAESQQSAGNVVGSEQGVHEISNGTMPNQLGATGITRRPVGSQR